MNGKVVKILRTVASKLIEEKFGKFVLSKEQYKKHEKKLMIGLKARYKAEAVFRNKIHQLIQAKKLKL